MARDAVAEVRDRTDIVELVESYVKLKRSGRSYKGLCPFHQEKTPSFHVFPESQNFHCFGCGKGGDAFTFYMGVEHVEFREALQELARRAGVELEHAPRVPPEVDAHRERLIELNELAAAFYANILTNTKYGAPGRELAEKRGLSADVIARFGLGFAFESWDALLRYLSTRGVDPALAAEAGLLQTRESGGYYDRFRNRFMFPIRNRDGRVVGFGGRALGDAQPKYLNSPQSAIFDKSALVYGLDLAKEEIRRRDQVVIVEGYMDAIAAHQFGHANVVAAMGTAVTEAQVALVKRLSKHIVLALDADTAGQMATLRGLETMQEALDHDEIPVPDAHGIVRFERKLNAEIAIVQLPEGKDPDELIRRDAARWPEVVASAQPFMDFYIGAVTAGVAPHDARAKAEAVARVAPLLRQLDRVVQAHYVSLLARRLHLTDERPIRDAMRGASSRPAPSQAAPGEPWRRPPAPPPLAPRVSHEEHLLALLLKHRSLCLDVIPDVPEEALSDARNRELLRVLRDEPLGDLEGEQIVAALDDALAEHGERLLQSLAGTPADLPGQIRNAAQQSLRLLRRERHDFLSQQVQLAIAAAQESGDAETVRLLTRELAALTAERPTLDPGPSPYFRDLRDRTA